VLPIGRAHQKFQAFWRDLSSWNGNIPQWVLKDFKAPKPKPTPGQTTQKANYALQTIQLPSVQSIGRANKQFRAFWREQWLRQPYFLIPQTWSQTAAAAVCCQTKQLRSEFFICKPDRSLPNVPVIAGIQKNYSFGAREGIVSPTFPPHRHGVKPQQQQYVVKQSSLEVNFSFANLADLFPKCQ